MASIPSISQPSKVKEPKPRPYACEHCSERYRKHRGLRQHIQEKHKALINRFKCSDCSKDFFAEQSLLDHCKSKNHTAMPRNFSCVDCTMRFSTSAALLAHMPSHTHTPPAPPNHVDPSPPQQSEENYLCAEVPRRETNALGMQCTVCLTWVGDWNDLLGHFGKRHPRSTRPTYSDTVGDGGRINIVSAREHRTCTNRCSVCRGAFVDMHRHYNLWHPSLSCKDCGTLFACSLDTETHYRDAKDHKCCCLCNKSYDTTLELETHLSIHHGANRPPAACLECGKQYLSEAILLEHIQAIHTSDEPGFMETVAGTIQYRSYASLPPSGAKSAPEELSAGALPPADSEQASDATEMPSTPLLANISLEEKAVSHENPDHGIVTHAEHGTSTDAAESPSNHSVEADAQAPVETSIDPAKVEETPDTEPMPDNREYTSPLAVSNSDSWSNVDDLSDFASIDGDVEDNTASMDGHEDVNDQTAPADLEKEDGTVGNPVEVDTSAQRDVPPTTDTLGPSLVPATETIRSPPTEATQAWLCKVCNNTPTSPTVTMCGHLFCRGCIIAEISTNLCCPSCKRPILVQINL